MSGMSDMSGNMDEPCPAPIFYTMTDPNEELKPIGVWNGDDFLCDTNEQLIHCFEERVASRTIR